MGKLVEKPAAFMCYSTADDKHEHGQLADFSQQLSGEVRMQTGEDFPIFVDRKSIDWGEKWRERIEESLSEVTFLIPIITPSFFKSPECCREVELFLEREKRLGRSDLILPVYYVTCPQLSQKQAGEADSLAGEISSRQYADWRVLRFEPLSSPQVKREFAKLAIQLRNAIDRTTSRPSGSKQVQSPTQARKEAVLDFTLPVVGSNGLTGQTITLSSFRRKVVLLEFMIPWSPHCQHMVPALDTLYSRYGGDVVFISVEGPWNGATADDAASFIRTYGTNWITVYDSSGTIFSNYGVQATPTFFIVRKDGTISSTIQGEQTSESLSRFLEQELLS